jgi:tetratricopeptide (TPR) repeat protein
MVLFAVVAVTFGCSDPDTAKREALARGNAYLEEKKYAEAIIEYRNALSNDARFVEPRQKLIEAYAATNNAAAAYGEVIRVADLLPEDAGAQLRAGQALLMNREFEDARTRARRAIEIDPKSVQAHVLLANATAGLRDLDGAIQQIEEAVELDPANSRTHENFAVLQLAAGRNEEAEAMFKKAVELDGQSITALLGLAGFYLGTGQQQAAEPLLKRALEISPDDFLANRAMAAYHMSSGRPLEAEPYVKSLARIANTSRAQLALANYYVMTKRVPEGEAILRSLTNDREAGTSARVALAQLAYARRETTQAHELLDATITREPQNALPLLHKARFLLVEAKLQEAEDFAARAVKVAPTSAPVHYLHGLIQARRNDSAGAVQSFREVLKVSPRATAAKLQLSTALMARGEIDESVRIAEEVLREQPDALDARLVVVRGAAARGDVTRALTDVTPLLKQYPAAAGVHIVHGGLLLQRQDVGGARRAFSRAAELRPDSIDALRGLVLVDVAERKGADAVARVERRLSLQPNDPALLMLAAMAYGANGDREKMESTLQQVLAVAPGTDQASWMLGQYYLASQQPGQALAQFDRLSQRTDNQAASTVAAMVVQQQGQVDEAARRYEEILAKNPNSAIAANNLAWIYADRGDRLDEAQRLAQRASELAPKDPRIADTVGWVYYKRNLPLLAVPQFQRSVELDPKNPDYHYHLGLALARGGDSARARQSLERALALRPDFSGSEDAKQVLGTLK